MGCRVLTVLGFSLLFVGLLLLCAESSPQSTWGYAAYEIVTPKKASSKAGRASQSYFISVQSVNYTIHLRQKKDIIAKNFPVLTHDSEGRVMIEQPRVLADCYYQGYVEGIPDSTVTLTTCSVLRGLLQVGNVSYSIEPLAASSTFEHLLLQREVAVAGTVIYKITVPIALVLAALLIVAIRKVNTIIAFFSTSSSTETPETPESEEQNMEDEHV